MAAADDFYAFTTARRSDLERIARAAGGGCEFDEVISHAWLLAEGMRARLDGRLDLTLEPDQEALLGRLYVALVKRREPTLRFALQLDHAPNEDSDAGHPLKAALKAPPRSDPLVAALDAENAEPEDPNPHTSIAAAYLRLLALHGHDIPRVARYLLISDAYCKQQISYASLLAAFQCPLPSHAMPSDDGFVPKPWRQFIPTKVERSFVDLTMTLCGVEEESQR